MSAYYWPEVTGTAPYVTAPARRWAEAGHDVEVVSAFPHYPQWRAVEGRRLWRHEEHDGVSISRRWHTIPSKQSTVSRALYEASLLVAALSALPRRHRPDVIVGVTPALSSGIAARAASQLFGRNFGLIVHDLMGRGAAQSGVDGGERVAATLERVEIATARRARHSIVLTAGFRRFFVEAGIPGDRFTVAPTWSLRDPPDIDRSAVRLELGWSPSETVVVHGGNLGQKQGLMNVIDAAQMLGSRHPQIRIEFVGDGNDRQRLEHAAAERELDNVTFRDVVPPARFDELIAAADVLLLNQRPSVADMSLPSKLSAYFAAGRPVVAAVAANSVAAAEIRSANAGVVVDPNDPADLAAALVSMSDDPTAGEAQGAAAKRYAAATLSASAVLPRYDELLERIHHDARQ